MEMQQLNDWINNPELMGEETLGELRSLISRYPYFQTAWLLYLKNLYLLNNPSFKEELRRGALYVADLSVLFYFIEGNKYSIEHRKNELSNKPVVHDRTLDLIDRFLSEIPNDKGFSSELSIPMDTVMDYSSLLLLNSGSGRKKEEEVEVSPLKGQDLIDSFIQKSETGKIAEDKDDVMSEEDSGEDYYDEVDDTDYCGNECKVENESHQDDTETAEGSEDWIYDSNGEIKHFPIDNYFYEGKRETNFLDEKVLKYHRTLTTYINTLIKNGFVIKNIIEPTPNTKLLKTDKSMQNELRRPMMLIIKSKYIPKY